MKTNKRIAVVYRSVTGHSKKLALAIAENFEVKAESVKDKPFLFDIDVVFIVGGIYSGRSRRDLIKYLKSLNVTNARKAILITSSAKRKDKQYEVRGVLAANGIEVCPNEYECLGGFLLYKVTHPTKDEIANAVAFAEEQVKNIKK